MNERGFTLVETLVSLIAGGLLLGSISWIIAGLSDDLKTTEELDQELQISDAADLLEDILADGRFLNASSEPLSRSSQVLQFQMLAPLSIGKRGYVDARLMVERSSSGESLKLHWPGQELPQTILLSGMQDIELRYEVDTSENGGAPTFLKKVEIAVTDQIGSEMQTLTVRPRINAVGACVFDLISQRCRT